jgi:hypothetical protein
MGTIEIFKPKPRLQEDGLNRPNLRVECAQWPKSIDNLADAEDTEIISVQTNTKNLERLTELQNIKKLFFNDAYHKDIKIIASCKAENVYIYSSRVDNGTDLQGMPNLKVLCLPGARKFTSLDSIGLLTNLERLFIEDCVKIKNINGLGNLKNLKELEIRGFEFAKMEIESLSPLTDLKKLEYLTFVMMKVKDGSLAPLGNLKSLKKLNMNDYYPTEEYAKLSVHLPGTECEYFQPYFKDGWQGNCKKCHSVKDIYVTGYRKPALCPKCDQHRMKKYAEQYIAFRTSVT